MTVARTTEDIMAYVTAFIEQGGDLASLREDWGSAEHATAIGNLLGAAKVKTKLKDPDKPKRGKSSYLFYCADERNTVKSEMPTAKPTEVTAELGRRWRLLKESKEPADAERREKYVKAAEEDKQRYQAEIGAYVGPTDGELTTKPGKPRKASGESGKTKTQQDCLLLLRPSKPSDH